MMNSKRKVVFLDRDGVINKDVGYLHKIADVEFVDGLFEVCQHFQTLGYELVIVSNQSGIARGYYSQQDFHTVTEWMIAQCQAQNMTILDVFFCPHGPDSHCECRKPRPGMLLAARDKYNIDMSTSWMIGDKETDISAANAAGVYNTLLVKSQHRIDAVNSQATFIVESIRDSIPIIK